jgi:hypothetical protein
MLYDADGCKTGTEGVHITRLSRAELGEASWLVG